MTVIGDGKTSIGCVVFGDPETGNCVARDVLSIQDNPDGTTTIKQVDGVVLWVDEEGFVDVDGTRMELAMFALGTAASEVDLS